MKGHNLLWVSEIRYLGAYIIKGRQFRCSVTNAKRSFNRSINAIFGKVGRSLRRSYSPLSEKQKPAHSPGLKCYSLLKADLHSLDFVHGHEIFNETFQNRKQGHHRWICRSYCHFPLPWSEMLEIKSNKFCKKSKCNKIRLRYFNINVS